MKYKLFFDEIREMGNVGSFSKNEQLIQGIINAIDQKVIFRGDILPSVNRMIKETGFARETIVKAYKGLIDRGIIEPKNRRGFFVTTEDTYQHLKVCLLLYAFDTFQETFYESFRNQLGENIHLDVFFHHNNFEIFETIISNNKGKYGMYVIAPIQSPEAATILEQLPMNKLLLVDRFLKLKEDHSYITQEFEQSSYNAFVQLAPRIKEFSEFVFFFKPASAEPSDVFTAFKRFIDDYNIKGVVRKKYEVGSIEANKVYFTIHNLELWEILKDSKTKGLRLGENVGVLSHNDDHVKEIIFDGITTFSIDFSQMGKLAADFVLKREPIKYVMNNELIRRNSL